MAFCEHDPGESINPSTISFIIFWFALLLLCLFNIIFGSCGIHKVIQSHKKKECTDNILYILVTILFIMSPIGFFFLVASMTFCWLNNIGVLVLKTVSAFTYLQGVSLLYLLYYFRLKKMFKSTEFSLAFWPGIICLFGYFLQCILIVGVSYYALVNEVINSLNAYIYFGIINFAFNAFLLFIFIRKVYKIAQITVLSIESNRYSSSKIQMQRLLTPTIRIIICAFIAMMSSSLLGVKSFIRTKHVDTHLLWISHISLALFDMSINIVCLYLQYSFGDRIYEGCCRRIHICVNGIFVRKVNRENNTQINLDPSFRSRERGNNAESSTNNTVTETQPKLSAVTEESNIATASHLKQVRQWMPEDDAYVE
eukprot:470183_1